MSRPSYLSQALQAEIVDLVGINQVKFLALPLDLSGGRGAKTTLGVRGLGACSVIVITSQNGIIAAHVGPNVIGSDDPRSYITLAHHMMN